MSQFGNLDVEINKRTDALKDVAFPSLSKKATMALTTTNSKYKDKLKDLERCRMTLEQWIFFVIGRIDFVPADLKYGIEMFMFLPNGPDGKAPVLHYDDTDLSIASLSSLAVPTKSGLHNIKERDEDASSVASSQYTNGSLDSTGVPKQIKKPRRRLMKGAKRRMEKLLGVDMGLEPKKSVTEKETFGVDFSQMTTGDARNGVGSLIDSQVSGTTGTMDANHTGVPYKDYVDNQEPQKVQPGKLLKIRVARGAERSKGNPEYEIYIEFNPDKKPYSTTQIFGAFDALREGIIKADGVGVTAEFPESYSKSSFGLSLSEEQQAERTRLLDSWVKNIISSYQYMNDKERMLIRKFLNLELSVQKDIYIQDKMANGLVEAPRASRTSIDATPLTTHDVRSDTGSSRVSLRNSASFERMSSAVSISSVGSAGGGAGSATKNKSTRRQSLKGISKSLSRSFSDISRHDAPKPVAPVKSYAVTIVNSNSGTPSKAQQKLAFNDLATPVFTDEDTIDSDKTLSGTSITNTIEGNSHRHLSQIKEERESQGQSTSILKDTISPMERQQKELQQQQSFNKASHEDDMQQNLLRIGTTKKKKSSCCCVVS